MHIGNRQNLFPKIKKISFLGNRNPRGFFNDISLSRYDIRRCRMIYLLRGCDIISVPSYAVRLVSPHAVRYHIEDISPVPAGTDIIEKSVPVGRFFPGAGGGGRTRTGVSPTDFESASSANSNTPACCLFIIICGMINCNCFFCRISKFAIDKRLNPLYNINRSLRNTISI